MDRSSLERFKKKALRFAKKSKLAHEAEDFASYALLKHAEGNVRPLYGLWVDYLRENYGDLRSQYRQDQDRLGQQSISSREWADERAFLDPKEADHNVDFGFILRFLSTDGEWFTQRDRTALVLKYEWGASHAELAYMFGVSDAMISKMMSEIEDRVKHMISAQLDEGE